MRLAPMLACLFTLIYLVIFLLQEIRCGGLFVHLVGVGVGELACFLFVFLFLLSSSPIIHLALIRLVAFLVAYVANHDLSFIKLRHSLDGVILMKLGLLCFATSCVYVSTTTFSTQTWLHKDESKYKSLQEIEASF